MNKNTVYGCTIIISALLGACSSGSSSSNNAGGGATTGSVADEGTNTAGTTEGGTTGGTTGSGTTTGGTTGVGTTTGGDTGTGTTTGGSNVGNTGGGNVTLWGFVEVESTSFDTVDITAGFTRFNSPIAASTISDFLVQTPGVCDVSVSTPNTDPGEIDFDEIEGIVGAIETVSAGEAIVFTGPAGTFAQLDRVNAFGFTFYESNVEDLAGPIPQGLSMDIPGDVFPAFSDVAIAAVEPITGLSPTFGTQVTPSTTFTWDAGDTPGAVVDISVTSVDFTTGEFIDVDCVAADTGSFSFSGQTQAEMVAAGFETGSAEVTRSVVTTEVQGNALLIVGSTGES